jgi:cyclase
MRRIVVLVVIVGTGLLLAAACQQEPSSDAAAEQSVEVEQLADNLFVLRGGGGNTAVFVQSSGVTVVDTKNPGWGQTILTAIQELTDEPVVRIINTHTHGDHVSGNVEFPSNVEVVTHQNTRVNMFRGRGANPSNIFRENENRGLPTRTFSDNLTIGTGPDEIDLRYFGRGHTNGDAWVVFPALRVVHAGDLFSGKNIPYLDGNNGGSGVELPDTLAKAHDGLTEIDRIITGHSTVMTRDDLMEYADFNRDFLEAVREAKEAGRTAEDVASTWTIPEQYQGYAEPQAERLRSNVELVYDELP